MRALERSADMPRMILKTIYLTPEQDVELRKLSERSRLSVSHHVRSGVDLLLAQEGEQSEKTHEKADTKVR